MTDGLAQLAVVAAFVGVLWLAREGPRALVRWLGRDRGPAEPEQQP